MWYRYLKASVGRRVLFLWCLLVHLSRRDGTWHAPFVDRAMVHRYFKTEFGTILPRSENKRWSCGFRAGFHLRQFVRAATYSCIAVWQQLLLLNMSDSWKERRCSIIVVPRSRENKLLESYSSRLWHNRVLGSVFCIFLLFTTRHRLNTRSLRLKNDAPQLALCLDDDATLPWSHCVICLVGINGFWINFH